MNEWQKTLYDDLIRLTKESDSFYFSDAYLNGVSYRIFNYRIASYTEFTKPNALECRGHMFEMNGEQPLKLVCLPMEKFFNLNENPFTQNWDLTKVVMATVKEDGSLISTFWQGPDNNLGKQGMYLKSKGSLTSKQCQDATKWSENNLPLHSALQSITQFGYTVNMEWVAPDNRIVLAYDKPALKILNVRDTRTGQYIPLRQLTSKFPVLIPFKPAEAQWLEAPSMDHFLKVKSLIGVEGYVIELEDGRKAKVKTDWYCSLHKTKESVDSDKKLFETIIRGAHDDLKSIFHDNEYILGKIKAMEDLVIPRFKETVRQVESFYKENADLDRKSYAISAQQKLDHLMGLAMNKYLKRETNYEDYVIKYADKYLDGFSYSPQQID